MVLRVRPILTRLPTNLAYTPSGQSTREAERLRATGGTAAPSYTSTARGHATRRPDCEPIKGLLLPTPHLTWYMHTVVFGYAQWRKDRMEDPSELTEDCRAWSASMRLDW